MNTNRSNRPRVVVTGLGTQSPLGAVDEFWENLKAGTATGIQFSPVDAENLKAAVNRAIELFRRPRVWRSMMGHAMRYPVGWEQSAPRYLELYEDVTGR